MIIATAGHIDHGKTLLLKALTGVDTDRLPEEKKRGLSIDLGFAYSDLGNGYSLGFIDVPGHERFIRNMLAGIAGIDFVLLVIAADDGPMPQTLEHLAILNLLGVNRGAIALSKVDKVSSKRIDVVEHDVKALLQNTSLSKSPIFPLSGLSGLGVQKLRNYLEKIARQVCDRDHKGNFRLAIDRCFTVTGSGTVVTGSVLSGTVKTGDRLKVSPKGTEVRVRGIYAQNQPSQTGVVGQRCALNIAGSSLNKSQINRGDWLVDGRVHAPINRFDASLHINASEKISLKNWTPAHLYLGTANVTCRIAVLIDGTIEPGKTGLAQIVSDQPIIAVHGDRFILRDQSAKRTIAGGIIVDPFSPARGRARPQRIAWLKAMAQKTPAKALRQLLEQSPEGIDLDRFAQSWNLTYKEAEKLYVSKILIRFKKGNRSWGVGQSYWQAYGLSLIATIKNWHKRNPERLGPHEYELNNLLNPKVPISLMHFVIRNHISAGILAQKGTIIHEPAHQAHVSVSDLKVWDIIDPIVRDAGVRPPLVKELAIKLQINPTQFASFLKRATHLGWLIKVTTTRYFHPSAVLKLAEIAEALAVENDCGEFTPSSYRDRSGIGRNLTIEVLEFFDKIGFTRRTKTGRQIKTGAMEIFG
jgi:selenocysteine-specific elongation factor